jgi:hypothetical protein
LSENPSVFSKTVNWHYEEGDDESYETGREFESLTRLNFNFLEYAEVPD